jgi:AcrR family transcriptional regulator
MINSPWETQETIMVSTGRNSSLRDRIVQTALTLIFKHGFRRFTIDDIASELGISKKTIYHYFDSKEEIVAAAVDARAEMEKSRILEAMAAAGSWIDRLSAFLGTYSDIRVPAWLSDELLKYYPDLWAKLKPIKDLKAEQVRALVAEGISKGVLRPGIHPAIIELTFRRTVEGFLDSDFYNYVANHDLSLKQALEDVKEIILYGILKNNQRAEGMGT